MARAVLVEPASTAITTQRSSKSALSPSSSSGARTRTQRALALLGLSKAAASVFAQLPRNGSGEQQASDLSPARRAMTGMPLRSSNSNHRPRRYIHCDTSPLLGALQSNHDEARPSEPKPSMGSSNMTHATGQTPALPLSWIDDDALPPRRAPADVDRSTSNHVSGSPQYQAVLDAGSAGAALQRHPQQLCHQTQLQLDHCWSCPKSLHSWSGIQPCMPSSTPQFEVSEAQHSQLGRPSTGNSQGSSGVPDAHALLARVDGAPGSVPAGKHGSMAPGSMEAAAAAAQRGALVLHASQDCSWPASGYDLNSPDGLAATAALLRPPRIPFMDSAALATASSGAADTHTCQPTLPRFSAGTLSVGRPDASQAPHPAPPRSRPGSADRVPLRLRPVSFHWHGTCRCSPEGAGRADLDPALGRIVAWAAGSDGPRCSCGAKAFRHVTSRGFSDDSMRDEDDSSCPRSKVWSMVAGGTGGSHGRHAGGSVSQVSLKSTSTMNHGARADSTEQHGWQRTVTSAAAAAAAAGDPGRAAASRSPWARLLSCFTPLEDDQVLPCTLK